MSAKQARGERRHVRPAEGRGALLERQRASWSVVLSVALVGVIGVGLRRQLPRAVRPRRADGNHREPEHKVAAHGVHGPARGWPRRPPGRQSLLRAELRARARTGQRRLHTPAAGISAGSHGPLLPQPPGLPRDESRRSCADRVGDLRHHQTDARRRAVARHLRLRSNVAGFVIAAVWVAHPLTTGSVTYVAQRVESLMGLFYAATLYFAIRALDGPRTSLWPAPRSSHARSGWAPRK